MKIYDKKTIYSIGEAAELLGVHIDTVRNWEKKGLLQSVKTPGGHRRYTQPDLEAINKEKIMNDETEDIFVVELNQLAGTKECEPKVQHELTAEEKEYLKEKRMSVAKGEDKYWDEACLLTKRWEKTRLLKGVDDDFKPVVAVLLENQRLVNEASVDSGDIAQFKRISIPIVRRIWGMSMLRHFASIQPMLGPTGLVYYFKNNQIIEDDVAVKTFKMKAVWSYEAQQDLRSAHNLDAEAELCAILALELAVEIDRRGLTDMLEGAALKKEVDFSHLGGETINDKWAAIQELVVDLAMENQSLYHRPFANWIVTNKEMAETICPQDNDLQQEYYGLGVRQWGSLSTDNGDIKVWIDPLFAEGKILLGYRGEHKYDAGYIHAPYVCLTQTPVVLDPDTFIPRKGIMSRFGIKMVDETYFSVLKVKNFISQKKHADMEAAS